MRRYKLKLVLILSLVFVLSSPVFAQELEEAMLHRLFSKVLPFENMEF